jgi:hypothetical protein
MLYAYRIDFLMSAFILNMTTVTFVIKHYEYVVMGR